MRHVLWVATAILLCRGGAVGPDGRPDARLDEARDAYEEAVRLENAGQYPAAMEKAERALALREAALGKDHPDVAASLNRVAILFDKQGQYAPAEPLHRRALAIREAALGKDHPDVAASLNNLSILASHLGNYDQAELLNARAMAIREARFGRSHPEYAASLNNQAILSFQQGKYAEAEPLYQRVLAIREATLGKSHPEVAGCLNNLASVYQAQGLYARAEALQRRAIELWESALGREHPHVAGSLNNLANLFREQGRYAEAEPLYRRAIAIQEAALGKSHPDVAQSLENLAALYQEQGQYAKAEPLYRRAVAIQEAAGGPSHPALAQLLGRLASLHVDQGRYDLAEPLAVRALEIWESAMGDAHPELARPLSDFARFRVLQGRLADALPLFARALAIDEQRLRREALDFSEARLATFLQYLRRDEQRLYSLARAHPDDPEARRLALGSALLFKGRSLAQAAETSRTILRSLDPADREAFERLRGLRTQLAQVSLGGQDVAGQAKRLKQLAEEGDALEAALAQRSAPLRALAALPSAGDVVARVASALPRDGALVELVAYDDRPLVPKAGVPEARQPQESRYLALALFPDGRTAAADLGPAGAVDTAASRLRDALATRDAEYLTPARELYRLAFAPLRPLLAGARRVYLAPDGQLTLAPFAALHDGTGFLADAIDATYLTSGRDLLPPAGDVPPSTSVVVLADPDGGPADALPGTRREAEAIRRLFPRAELYAGAEASKERLLSLRAPGLLHVATHGFFLPDPVPVPGTRALGAADVAGPAAIPRPQDPLLRSGLVLAGTGGPAEPGRALVTALELSGLDLWGTQLVVLSACDTGRGDIRLGQGVYGLRRALVVAGAETVVVSLWKVDDETTEALMERFYQGLLGGRGRAAALREASLAIRARHPHPHAWAPFIALGRDAPLRGLR